jgi:4-aminobutyrate aminotransferase
VRAKAIASGLPLSGLLAPRDLLDRFSPGSHGGTYGGNAVACAAALATLDVIDDEGLAANAERLGGQLLARLGQLAERHPLVAEVRGRGMMIGIEFAQGERLTPRPDLTKALLAEAVAKNLLLLSCGTYGQVVRVIPPLVTTEEDIDLAYGVIADGLRVIGA